MPEQPDFVLGAVADAHTHLDPAWWRHAGQAADRADLDLLVVEDDLLSGVDASVALASLAAVTTSTGLVPAITTTHTEPFHVATVLATLDHASHGRAGWLVGVSPRPEAAAAVGRRPVADEERLLDEAGEVIRLARDLWDSWEDDAVVRDVTSGRFVDRDRLHHVRHEGRWFDVMGPAIAPRPPQGHLPVLVRAASPASSQLAGEVADVVLLSATEPDEALDAIRRLAAAARGSGRSPSTVRSLVELDVGTLAGWEVVDAVECWWKAGAPGVLLHGVDLDGLAQHVATELVTRGIRREPQPGRTLRQRLGLARPANRFAVA